MKTITLTKVHNSLNRSDQDNMQWEFVPGDTLSTLVDNSKVREIICRDSLKLAISVNGVYIPEEHWCQTQIMEGQHVTLIPVLCGGGDGKDIARMIGMVVLMVATIAVAGPLAGMIGAYGVVGGMWGLSTGLLMAQYGGIVIGSMLMVGGSLLLNAAIGTSRPPTPALNGYAGMDQSNSYSWNPSTTQQQGTVLPWHYGTCKITGNIIGVYRESIGDQQYLNVLISLGEGPISAPYDIKLNNQPLSSFSGVTLHTRLGHLNQDLIQNFADTRTEYPLSNKVIKDTPVTYTTIGTNFDTLEIEVSFPGGLGYYSDNGSIVSHSVNFSVEVKKTTDSTWTHLARTALDHIPSAAAYWSVGKWVTYITDYGDYQTQSTVWEEVANGGAVYADHYEGEAWDSTSGYAYRWIGDSIPLAATTVNYERASKKTKSPVRYTYRLNDLLDGTYDVRVTRLTDDQTDSRYLDALYLTAIREIILDDFTYPGEALIGLRSLANDQLSGSLSFECKTAGKLCRVYDSLNVSRVVVTSNPAWVCFDILTQPIFDTALNVLEYRAHNPANLNITRFLEWADYCADLVPDGYGGFEERLTWNGQFDSSKTMWDAAMAVAKIGRAVPYWQGTIITVAIDKPSTPVTMISVGNSGVDSFEETFLSMENRAGTIEADFINSANGYERDKITVINPSAPENWGKSPLALQGVIKPSEVYRHCMYYLATTQNLIRVVTVQMDIDSIAFTLGDVINVQHDVPMWGEGGRLVSATTTQLVLDKDVTIAAGHTYNIMVRLLDGTIVERQVSNSPGTTDTLTVGTPFSSAPVAYDVYAFGETSIFVKPLRVIGIDPAGDLRRKITLTDYNESIWNADLGIPVIRTTNYTYTTLPVVTGLLLSEHLAFNAAGVITPMLDIQWDRVTASHVRYVELIVNSTSKGLYDQETTGMSLPANELETYTVQLRTVPWIGTPQNLSLAAIDTYTVLGKSASPAPPTGLSIFTQDTWIRFAWKIPGDIDLDGFKIKVGRVVWGADDEAANGVDVFDTGIIDSIALLPNQTGTINVMIKSVDTTGNYSAVATVSKTIAAPFFPNGSNLIPQVIDNNVLLSWSSAVVGDYPVDQYEIRRGSDYATATVIGHKSGTFTTIFETVSGTYKYWVTAIDTAGQYSDNPLSTYAAVAQPPDFILQSNLYLNPAWAGTKNNCFVDLDKSLTCLVNLTETWEQHFVNHSWDQPSDQINAGYPIYSQPGTATAYYEETIDYGTAIASSKIVMDVTRTTPAGVVTIVPKISVKLNIGDAWTDYTGVYQVYSTGFRYVKYRLDLSSASGGILNITQFNVRLEMKQKTYEGVVSCSSGDSGGTLVDITGRFIDVNSIQVTPLGTTPIIAVYDFVDVPNPTSFKILLFTTGGARTTATASYIIRGV